MCPLAQPSGSREYESPSQPSKARVPLFQEMSVRLGGLLERHPKRCAMKPLEAVNQHRAVLLFQDVLTNLHYVVWPDTEQVRVEGGVMQPAEGETI